MKTSTPRIIQNPEYLHEAEKHHGKCVCQICNCDKKHKCPERGYRLQTETTNHFYYKPHTISPEKRQRVDRKPLNTHYPPEDLMTNYKATYIPHPSNNYQSRPRTAVPQYSPSKFKLQDQTQYRKKYSPIKMNTEASSPTRRKKYQYMPSPHKFEGNTTYNAEYSPKKIDQSSPERRKKYEYSPSKFPLQTETTYNNFYKPHQAEAYSTPNRPEKQLNYSFVPNKQKFQGQSRYRQFYVPKEIKPVHKCPADILPRRPIRCSPDKDHTYYNSTINRWE